MLGTLNFLAEAKRREGAALVRRGVSFSLAQSFDMNGPQRGWRRRTNPVHTMLDTGTDAERGTQGFPHGIGGADDVIHMPLQASTQWDGISILMSDIAGIDSAGGGPRRRATSVAHRRKAGQAVTTPAAAAAARRRGGFETPAATMPLDNAEITLQPD